MEQLSVSTVTASLKRRHDRLLSPFNVIGSRLNGLFSKVGTPARKPLIYRRYTGPIHAASATRGNSRQTDFKGRPLQRNVRFCHALSPLSVTGKQRFTSNGSTVPEWLMLQLLRLGHWSAAFGHSGQLA